ASGTYAVTLIISTTENCVDTAYGFAEVWPNPVADFTTSPVCVGYPTQFTDQSVANADSLVPARFCRRMGQGHEP
ncbi:MAG: hypothetical protein RRA35_14585, partial [Desulfomonilia bacterium]|nr:hypothetical protein [Desulfomonilia bacterium]